MRGLWPRFDAALFSVFVLALAGCGGGGSGSSSTTAANFIPLPAPTQSAAAAGPVSYMQSNGPLSSSGSISQGTHQALVAVMSNAAQASKGFAADTLLVSGSGTVQSAARTAAVTGRPTATRAHAVPVEGLPADDSALMTRLRAFAVGSSSGANGRRASQSVAAGASVGTHALIWVQQGSLSGTRTNVQVGATLVTQSAHGNIWIDDSIAGAIGADASQIAADFENAYASDTAHFGTADYPSNAPGMQPQYSSCSSSGAKQGTTNAYIAEPADRRINVMVVSSQNLGGLGGYFSGANYMHQNALNCVSGGYKSNEAPFIFVGWFAGSGAEYELKEDLVRSTAHELQHLINFVNHALLAPGASSASFDGNEVPFINEGLSMLAQDFAVQNMYGAQGVRFDADDALERANAYLANPGNYSVSGFTGIDPAAWGGNGASAQYNCGGGCYGAAYLFQRYLRDRFGGEAYTHAIESSGVVGAENLNKVTGETAGSLLDDFALAMGGNTLGVTAADPRFDFGSLNLMQSYRDQFGGSTALHGVFAAQASGATTAVRAPVGGFAFVTFPSVPAGGMPVQVTDQAAASGFGLTGGLAQH